MSQSFVTYFPPELLECGVPLELNRGRMLYRRGDISLHIYLVESGRLCLHSLDTEGRSVPLYVVRPGECASEAALFADFYCSDVVAELPSRVRAFPKQFMLEELRRNPDFSERYMSEMARRFNALRVRLELRNLRSARERVLQYLLTATPAGETTVCIDRPLKSLAEDVGLTPESFYRTVASLASEGFLTRKGRSFVLLGRRLGRTEVANHTNGTAEATPT